MESQGYHERCARHHRCREGGPGAVRQPTRGRRDHLLHELPPLSRRHVELPHVVAHITAKNHELGPGGVKRRRAGITRQARLQVKGLGFRNYNSEFRIQGIRFGVQDIRFRAWG